MTGHLKWLTLHSPFEVFAVNDTNTCVSTHQMNHVMQITDATN